MGQNESSDIVQRKQRVSGIFDGAASTYGQVGPRFFSHFGRRVVEIAQIPSGSKVLDVATGRGALLYPAAEAVGPKGKVIGIDLSANMVQETNKELARKKISPNVEVCLMDAEHLQFSGELFDYVLCGFAIFFFPQLYKAMAEFHRVLKPAGRICVSTFDKLFYKEWSWFNEIVKNYLPSEHEETQENKTDTESQPVFDTPEGLKVILNSAEFDNIQIFTETAEFIYETEEEFWSSLWSHGVRRTLEEIEKKTGKKGLQKFKIDVFNKISTIKLTDGLHQLIPVHIGLASKPEV